MFNKIKALFKRGHKSKTVLFGYALFALTGLQGMSAEVAAVFKEHTPIVMLVIGFAVIVLRAVTSTALEAK